MPLKNSEFGQWEITQDDPYIRAQNQKSGEVVTLHRDGTVESPALTTERVGHTFPTGVEVTKEPLDSATVDNEDYDSGDVNEYDLLFIDCYGVPGGDNNAFIDVAVNNDTTSNYTAYLIDGSASTGSGSWGACYTTNGLPFGFNMTIHTGKMNPEFSASPGTNGPAMTNQPYQDGSVSATSAKSGVVSKDMGTVTSVQVTGIASANGSAKVAVYGGEFL